MADQADQRATAESIFLAALERPSDERAACVASACGDNQRLRQRVEALLRAHEAPEGFLPEESQTLAHFLTARLTEQPGDIIGRYKLREKLGEGGCGIVYLAEQEVPVKRKVALKIIKLGMDTKQVVARFDAERQALALMDHPNIAKVFDAGATETGRPYFVMELVGGVRITDYCDQHQLTIRQRLDLFIQVCRAIQHAHQKGVIHRDIKPSNVLVAEHDGAPVPKVIDFGIAKATQGRLTDQTIFTAFEQFLGTPAYMSPEQTQLGSLDVDTRSDIYSLGVLLYELLTGKTPFETKELLEAGLDAMRRTILEKEPLTPSTRLTSELVASAADSNNQNGGALPRRRYEQTKELIHHVRGDLDWIVMKCLEKDRARRYETANGLATDIQRHLNNEPVQARPPSKLYELQRTFSRHKFGFLATATIILLLAAGVTVSTRQAREQSRLRQEAQKARDEATERLWTAYHAQAQALRLAGKAGRQFQSLAALKEAAKIRPSVELRNEAIASLALPDLQRIASKDFSKTRQPVTTDLAFERYAVAERGGSVSVRRWADDIELTRLPGNGLEVTALSPFSPNGRFLPVRYANGHLRIWDLAEPTNTNQVGTAFNLIFAPDCGSMAIADGTNIVLRTLPDGLRVGEILLHGLASVRFPGSISFDPSGEKFAFYGGEDRTNVTVFDARSGNALIQLRLDTAPYNVIWHPDGRRLAVGCVDETIQIWDTISGERLRSWRGQSAIRIAFDHAGKILASSGWDNFTHLWDFEKGRELAAIQRGGVLLGFDPTDRRLALANWEGFWLELLDVSRGECFRTLYQSETPSRLAFEPILTAKGDLLAFGTEEGISLWDVEIERQLGPMRLTKDKNILGFDASGTNLILTGKEGLFRYPIAGVDERGVGFPSTAALMSSECANPEDARIGWMSQDGRTCALVWEGRGRIFRTDTFAKQAETELQPGMRFSALNADGTLFASGAWHHGGVRVWDTQTGSLIKQLLVEQENEDTATTVVFSPDGRRLVTGTMSGYSFWEVGPWTLGLQIPPPPGDPFLSRMTFSRDGSLFAASYAMNKLRVYSATTGEVLADLEAPDLTAITGLTFDKNGTRLFVAQSGKALRVWDFRLIRRRLTDLGLDWKN